MLELRNIKLFEPTKTLVNKGNVEDESACVIEDFECCTFDHSDNSPYILTVIRAATKCKKNRQENYEIVEYEPPKSPILRTFSAEEMTKAVYYFEFLMPHILSGFSFI